MIMTRKILDWSLQCGVNMIELIFLFQKGLLGFMRKNKKTAQLNLNVLKVTNMKMTKNAGLL